MCSRDIFKQLFHPHDNKRNSDKYDVDDCTSAYDDPETNNGCILSPYTNWVRDHVKVLMFGLLVVTSLTLAVILSILTYTYVNASTRFNSHVATHKINHVNLFTHHEHDLPDYDTEDYDDRISGPTNFEQSPFAFGERHKLSGLNFEQSDNYDSAVSHNQIFHELDDVFDSSSPDEYRVVEHGLIDKPLRRKHLKSSKFKEENAETRENNIGEDRKIISPPVNPSPTKRGVVINEKLATEVTEPKHKHMAETETPSMALYRVQNAVKAGAVCLDGSAPAYYHRPGTGNSEKLWIIHFNGGAWCFDAKACFERSRSSLGSTKKLPPSPPIIQGINSPDPSVNPDFYDWNLVWVVYCDGASFTGNRERPLISDSGETIYLRGKRVLNAIVNDLLYNRNFKLAKAIILTGSSAGSMTAMFQADYIASKFPKTIPVRVLSDAGFFIDTAPIGGKNLGSVFKKVYDLQNSSAGLNQDCVREVGVEDAWECFLPAKTMKYVKTPTFILNSAYDIWALIYFLNIDCKFPTLNAARERKKRNINQNLFVRSDSELDITSLSTEQDRILFRRDVRLFKRDLNQRMKRDVSGFEMLPFFRNPADRKDEVPTDKPSTRHMSDISNMSDIVMANANTTSQDTKAIRKPSKKKKHSGKSRFFNFIKELGEVTSSDDNMNTLFKDDMMADLENATVSPTNYNNKTRSNSTLETTDNTPKIVSNTTEPVNKTTEPVGNITEPVHNTSQTVNKTTEKVDKTSQTVDKSSEIIGQASTESKKENGNLFDSLFPEMENKDLAGLENKDTVTFPITTKSMIPSSTEKFMFDDSMNPVADMNNVLQGIDRLRKIKEQSRHIFENKLNGRQTNVSMAVKRHRLNETAGRKIKKSKRSTSLAKEYINILRSDPPECTEKEILNAMKYRAAIMHSTDSVMHMPKSGRFIVSCIDHSLSLFDETWTGLIVGGKSIQQAFGDWFYERGTKAKYDLIDCPYPCNPSCP